MKIALRTTLCGPNGNAFPGQVVNLSNDQARELLDAGFASTVMQNEKATKLQKARPQRTVDEEDD